MIEEYLDRKHLLCSLYELNTKLPKSKSKFRKDMIESFDKLTEDMEDCDLSSLMSKYLEDLLGDVSSIQSVLDRYIYLFRDKSYKDKLKFFMDYKPTREEYLTLVQNRNAIVNFIFQNGKELFDTVKVENHEVFDLEALSNYYDKHIPESMKKEQSDNLIDLISVFKEYMGHLPEDLKDRYSRILSTVFCKVCGKYFGDIQNFKKVSWIFNTFLIKERIGCTEPSRVIDYGDSKDIVVLGAFTNLLVTFVETKDLPSMDGYVRISSDYMSELQDIYLVANLNVSKESFDFNLVDSQTAGSLIDTKNVLRYLEFSLLDRTLNKSILKALNLPTDNRDYLSFRVGASFNAKIFYNRKVLLPKPGLVLRILDSDLLESMLVKELHLDSGTILYVVSRYNDGYEQSTIISINDSIFSSSTIASRVDSNDNMIIDYLYDLLGLNGDREKLKRQLNYNMCDLNYEVLAPVYWKYRDRGYMTPSEDEDFRRGITIKREYSIPIAPFIRKISGKPSEEALALAKKLCLTLEPGYTVVKEHERTYNGVANGTKRMTLV